MDQRMLSAICRIIVGGNGRRLGHPDVKTAYTQGLFADYYQINPWVCRQTCYKYLKGTTPYPHFLVRHYSGGKGYHRILGDMQHIVDQCASITLLRKIQGEMHQWVNTHLVAEDAELVRKNYVALDASRRDIAVFWADVMHYAICQY